MLKFNVIFSKKILSLVLISISFAYFFIGISQPINIYDEGIIVYGSLRILNGDIPYKDFWTMYAPGQFYILAGLFKIFGVSIFVERVWDICIRSLIALTVFLIAKKLVSESWAILSWFVSVLSLAYYGGYGYPIFPAILLSMFSILSLIHFFFQKQNSIWLIISGMLVSMAALFRHDLGFYTFMAETIWSVLFFLLKNEFNKQLKFIKILFYFLGVVIIFLPVALYFIYNVQCYDLLYNLIIFPITIFSKFRALPYPNIFINPFLIFSGNLSFISYVRIIIDAVPYYFPLLVYIMVIIMIITHIRKEYFVKKEIWVILLLLLIGGISFNQARIRSDLIHLPQTVLPAIVLIPPLIRVYFSKDSNPIHLVLGSILILLCIIILIRPIHNTIKIFHSSLLFSPDISHGIERAKNVYMESDQTEAINYIRTHVPEGEKIFVGNSNHDRIFINDIIFYFLAQRNSVTKYHELHPGIATTFSIQERIIKDIGLSKVQYIVLFSKFENIKEPNESSISSGVTLLDEFIRNNYYLVREFGNYTIWQKR